MSRHAWNIGALACLALGLAAETAQAQTPADRADAEALASAAEALAAQGYYGAACAKYDASATLDPSARRFMTLADCHERAGMTARAWMSFRDAQDWAKARGDKALAATAAENAQRLEATLARIEIVVPPDHDVEGLEIRRDGALLSDAVRGVPVPVDPGSHVISASAPGRRAWSATIGVSSGKATVSVTIPVLEGAMGSELPPNPYFSAPARSDDGSAPRSRNRTPLRLSLPPSADTPFDPYRGDTQRTVGWVLGGTGLAALAAGTILVLHVSAKGDSIIRACNTGMCPRDQLDTARSQADAADMFFLGGIASLAAGAVVYFTAPSRDRPERSTASFQVVPGVSAGGAGLFASGRF